jgi:hypothetical protein
MRSAVNSADCRRTEVAAQTAPRRSIGMEAVGTSADGADHRPQAGDALIARTAATKSSDIRSVTAGSPATELRNSTIYVAVLNARGRERRARSRKRTRKIPTFAEQARRKNAPADLANDVSALFDRVRALLECAGAGETMPATQKRRCRSRQRASFKRVLDAHGRAAPRAVERTRINVVVRAERVRRARFAESECARAPRRRGKSRFSSRWGTFRWRPQKSTWAASSDSGVPTASTRSGSAICAGCVADDPLEKTTSRTCTRRRITSTAACC